MSLCSEMIFCQPLNHWSGKLAETSEFGIEEKAGRLTP